MFIFICDLHNGRLLLLFSRCYQEKVIGMRDTVASREQTIRISQHLNTSIIVPSISQLLYLTVQIGLININTSVPNTDKIKRFSIWGPAIIIYIRVKTFCYILLITVGQCVNTQSIAIRLIPIACHTLPSHILTISRKLGINIITHIHITALMIHSLCFHCFRCIDSRLLITIGLTEILRLARTYII